MEKGKVSKQRGYSRRFCKSVKGKGLFWWPVSSDRWPVFGTQFSVFSLQFFSYVPSEGLATCGMTDAPITVRFSMNDMPLAEE